jgi:GDP-D-mannose 3',5'-epimerase
MYPAYNQEDPLNPNCAEDSAYPAAPDSEYGWEKLFSERLYIAYRRNYGLQTHIARYQAIEVWGDGEQTRSFLYIDECIEGTVRLLRSAFPGPVNIGSEEMITINHLVDLVVEVAEKRIGKKHIPGPQGVRGRNSDNRLILESLGWAPGRPLRAGLEPTYRWIEQQVRRNASQRIV